MSGALDGDGKLGDEDGSSRLTAPNVPDFQRMNPNPPTSLHDVNDAFPTNVPLELNDPSSYYTVATTRYNVS